jgi:hypothetical protein
LAGTASANKQYDDNSFALVSYRKQQGNTTWATHTAMNNAATNHLAAA